MEWQRIIELHDRRSGRFGTGYLLAPALALTARHVVDGLDGMHARLFDTDEDGLPGAIGPGLDARVVWSGPPDLDLALLAPDNAGASFRTGVLPVLIARLVDRAAVRVDALGFPRAMDTPTHADTLHVEALVSAWSGLRGSSLVLEVQTARPSDADAWKGMSGAAVFAGDRLVGAVEAVPALLADGALKAARADLLFSQEAAAALLSTSNVRLAEPVDAAYVDALPRAGHWSGVREQYARAIVTKFCRIDHVGIGVRGVSDRKTPALATYTGQRFAIWPD